MTPGRPRPPGSGIGLGAVGAARSATVRHHPVRATGTGWHHLARPIHLPPQLLHRIAARGSLESPWLAAGLAAVVVASAAVAVVRFRRRRREGVQVRHRGLRRAALAGWLAALTVLGALAGLNAYVGYIPTVPGLLGALPADPPGTRHPSRIETLAIGDPALDVRPGTAYIYLPPGYDDRSNAARRYPVVYLLHGYPGSAIDWFRGAEVRWVMNTMIAERLVQPMIVVAPDASGGWLHDSEMLNQSGGPQVEDYLTGTVVRVIDARYRTVADRSGRAIGGVSSGGYGALNLGLRHQDTYSVILSEMPYGDPGAVTRTLLGGSRAEWLANAPSHYIPTMTFRQPMVVDLLAGTRDPQEFEARRLGRMLTSRGQAALFTEVPGATHTWRGARAETPYALAFASQYLAGRRPPRGGTVTRQVRAASPKRAGLDGPIPTRLRPAQL